MCNKQNSIFINSVVEELHNIHNKVKINKVTSI